MQRQTRKTKAPWAVLLALFLLATAVFPTAAWASAQQDPSASEEVSYLDTVSVSLNTPNAEEYHRLVRSRFGEKSFDAMLDFARECTQYVPHVVMTTVDTTITKEEEEQCRKICKDLGVTYRVRPWED